MKKRRAPTSYRWFGIFTKRGYLCAIHRQKYDATVALTNDGWAAFGCVVRPVNIQEAVKPPRRIIGWRCRFSDGHFGPIHKTKASLARTVGLFGGRKAVRVYR